MTGASGFTGRYVCEALTNAGFDPAPLVLPSGTATVNLLQEDHVTDAVNHISPAAVIHLAAVSYVDHANVADLYATNIAGTRNLLKALCELNSKPEIVILASSANVYGHGTSSALPETAPMNPANDYAISKLAMEEVAKLWSNQLPICIARPFNYTGLGQAGHFLVPKIVNAFRSKQSELELGNLSVARDFSDVRDIAEMYTRLIRLKTAGEVINFCSGESIYLRDIVRISSEITGHNLKVVVSPRLIRNKDILRLTGCTSKLHKTLGTLPRRSFVDTLRWMLGAPTA